MAITEAGGIVLSILSKTVALEEALTLEWLDSIDAYLSYLFAEDTLLSQKPVIFLGN